MTQIPSKREEESLQSVQLNADTHDIQFGLQDLHVFVERSANEPKGHTGIHWLPKKNNPYEQTVQEVEFLRQTAQLGEHSWQVLVKDSKNVPVGHWNPHFLVSESQGNPG